MNYIKTNHLSLLIIAFMIVSNLFGSAPMLGALDRTTVGNPWTFTSTGQGNGVIMASTTITAEKVGQTGTQITRINTGICYIKAYAATIAASSTAAVDCQATAVVDPSGASALTGVTMGDNVLVQLSTTTAQLSTAGNLGLTITGASASTTSGYIVLRIANMLGTTFTWPIGTAATGTASYIVTK